IVFNRRIFAAEWQTILPAFNHIFGIGRNKRAAMIVQESWVMDDLLGLEVAQVNDRYAPVGFVTDEKPLAVIFTVGFAQGRMMGITPQNFLPVDEPLFQNLVSDSIAIT